MRPRTSRIFWSATATLAALTAMAISVGALFATQAACQPVITVDQPTANAALQGRSTLAGWALDQAVAAGGDSGTGDVTIYRDGEPGAGGVLVGQASRQARPDVDAAFGLGGAQAGWLLNADFSGMPAGPHTLFVSALTGCGWATTALPVVVRSAAPELNVDSPSSGQTVATGQPLVVGGWAADPAAAGTGIEVVQVFADGPADAGGRLLGTATYGTPRADVAAVMGKPEWTNAGFDFTWVVNGLPPGPHTLYVYARSAATGQWSYRTVDVNVMPPTATASGNPSPAYTDTSSSSTYLGPVTCGIGANGGQCTTAAGVTTGTCPVGYVLGQLGSCVPSSAVASCGPGLVYIGGQCVSAGGMATSCPAGYALQNGSCLYTGVTTVSCPPGYAAVNGSCAFTGASVGGCGNSVNPYGLRPC